MSLDPDWRNKPGYYVLDYSKGEASGFMGDATQPFLVVNVYYQGYKGGMSRFTVSRHETRKAAMAARRRAELRY